LPNKLSHWLAIACLLFSASVTAGAAVLPGDNSLWFDSDAGGGSYINLYFFWSLRCPHCMEARPYIESLDERYDWLRVKSYEVSASPENRKMFTTMALLLGEQPSSVPTFVLCGEMQVGWGGEESSGRSLQQRLFECYERVYGRPAPSPNEPVGDDNTSPYAQLALPGNVDISKLSLPALTLVLAGMDAFNPCAFFVLLFLLSLLVHTRSRRFMLLVGVTFVTISGVAYFAFMAAWLNLFLLFGELQLVTLLAGALAVLIASINIKDYFIFRQGVSLTLSETHKQGLFQRSRSLLKIDSVPALLASTVLLALVANTYELLCTAGFPMVYTRILTLNEVSSSGFYLYLVLYSMVYVLPLLLIVTLFVVTLGSRKLKETEGRFLKLLSGLMMLALGLLLLIAPERLNSLVTALALFLGAVLSSVLIAGLRRLLARPPA